MENEGEREDKGGDQRFHAAEDMQLILDMGR